MGMTSRRPASPGNAPTLRHAEPEVVPGASGTSPAGDKLPATGGGTLAGLAGLGLIGLAAGLRRRNGSTSGS